VARCVRVHPDLLLVRRGTPILRSSLAAIRASVPSAVIAGACNDDPFAPMRANQRWGQWRHFLAAVPEYDLVLASRRHNLDDFLRAGARRVELLRFWFVPAIHRPVALSDDERSRYGTDVVFVGHYEPDKRVAYLNALVSAGVSLRVFGREEYAKALSAAQIALCFFSTLNRDSHTFRSFEIPACGTAMLCEHTPEMASMFQEGVEAEFFRSKEELVAKAKALLADPERRARIAAAGRRRVVADGHDVVSRMRQVLGWVAEIRARR